MENAKKKFWKTPIINGVMITLKQYIFTRYASVNISNFLLNSLFLSFWLYEIDENC